MENKTLTASVFLDMSKAFDSVNHDLLIQKLWHIGLSNQAIYGSWIVFGTKQMLSHLNNLKLSLLGKELTPRDSVRDLGVYVDSQMFYDEHISKTVSSCISRLCQINRVKHVFDQKTLKLVISELVFTKLFYCSSVWSNTAKKNVNKITMSTKFCCANHC